MSRRNITMSNEDPKPNKPKEEMPEVYQEILRAKPTVEETLEAHEQIVPPKNIYSYNLKKIKSFKQIRRKYKMSNQEQVFNKDLNIILNEYVPVNHQLDKDLLKHVLTIAEGFFIYGNRSERDEMKERAVKHLMLKYFRGDEELLNVMISSVWRDVKKTNLFQRLYKRFKNNFFLK